MLLKSHIQKKFNIRASCFRNKWEIVKQLDDIIWWCGTIDNHIYDVDEEGVRHPRDIYQIRSGFAKRYNELKDELERGQMGGDNEFKYENN